MPKTYDSSDDEAGIWTGNFNGNNTYMYHRSPAGTATNTNPSTPRYGGFGSSKPTTPKSSGTSKSITGFHVRQRCHNQGRDDLAGRRRSANADILESLGLPSMVSFYDMKQLQDGVSEEDIRGPRKSKGHRRQRSRAVSVCLSTYNDCFRGVTAMVSDNAAQVAKRASQSLSSVARWTRKVTPTSMHSKKHSREQNTEEKSVAEVEAENEAAVFDEKKAHSTSSRTNDKQPFLSLLRERNAFAEATDDDKTL